MYVKQGKILRDLLKKLSNSELERYTCANRGVRVNYIKTWAELGLLVILNFVFLHATKESETQSLNRDIGL